MQLSLRGISQTFGTQRVLDEIGLEISDFHALVVIGPSGGGKSTLLRILAGLLVPDRGEMEINGRPVVFSEERLREYRRNLGTVFQSFNLFPHLTALENVTLPLEKVHGYGRKEAVAHAREVLARFRLEEHAFKRPGELSGGQQQRVAIARAVAVKPRFLLMDEPTSALDPEMTSEVLEVIETLRAEGRDLILVTHHMGFARHIGDHCVFLADGRIRASGPPGDLFLHPSDPLLQRFLSRVLRY
ncbi:MAG TPA: amino acid ABC transporter ATP-binding protein [Syntrophobacteraceae bacterium]|nr:amino acid ABC transporter ATP-binding protein [Syntrophobacteraceae bacterium]